MEMISQHGQKKALQAVNELEEFLLEAKPMAEASGLLENWERDRSIIQSAKAVILRSDQDEMKRFLEIDFRGWSHHFAVYCNDDAVGTAMDRFYIAVNDALRPHSPESAATQSRLDLEE
jgi:hypothetical protein